jgi:fumarate reductase (CoM/CoB) subunit B
MSKEMLTVRIFRYDPSKDVEPTYETYQIPRWHKMTVLEALQYIYERFTPIGFRYSCRFMTVGLCQLCKVLVNGKVVLACREEVKDEMTIEPIPNLPLIRDLVVDFQSYTSYLRKLPEE